MKISDEYTYINTPAVSPGGAVHEGQPRHAAVRVFKGGGTGQKSEALDRCRVPVWGGFLLSFFFSPAESHVQLVASNLSNFFRELTAMGSIGPDLG